jgi:hypothetical protein
VVTVCGVWMVGSFILLAMTTALTTRSGDPLEWLSPQAAVAEMFAMIALPLAYVAASWSRLLGRRSLGKRLFHLRVVRDVE